LIDDSIPAIRGGDMKKALINGIKRAYHDYLTL
jgi:hypothetical protein